MSTELCSVGSCFFPTELKKQILSSEPAMIAAVQLIINTMTTGCNALIQGRVRLLDPLPGDDQCQVRAIVLRNFSLSERVRKESCAFIENAKKANELINRRGSSEVCTSSSEQFFEEKIETISVSKEMAYLLQCRTLSAVTEIKEKCPNGVIIRRTNISGLESLSKSINSLNNKTRKKLVYAMQASISERSLAMLREEAEKIATLPSEEKSLVQRMLASTAVKKWALNNDQVPKSFACQFYQVKAVMLRLREMMAIVAIKSTVPETGFHLLFAPPKVGEEFALLSEKRVSGLEKDTPLFVIAGGVKHSITKELFAQWIEEHGLTNVVLACAAQQPPFNPSSTLEEVQDKEAREEISHFQEVAKIIGCRKEEDPSIFIYHMFCNSVGDELQ